MAAVQQQRRNKPNKALLEHNLNEVYRLMIAGMPNKDIMEQLHLPSRTYRRYVKMIRDRNIMQNLARRQEYFFDDITIAKDRLLAAKRSNLMVIHSPNTEPRDKIEALKLDAALTMTLLKLDYEGTVFLRLLNNNNNNGNDNIETPKLIQRQRDIIRSDSPKE